MSCHVRQDPESRLRVLEIAVLDACFNNVEGCGDDEGGGGARDGGDEVLAPGGGVVVFKGVDVLFGPGGTAKELDWRLVKYIFLRLNF